VLSNYLSLLKQNSKEIEELVTLENGKTLADSKGEMSRATEMIEFMQSASQLVKGDTLNNVSRCVDIQTYKYPIGVTASITAFNFPVMLPAWTLSAALVCGNS